MSQVTLRNSCPPAVSKNSNSPKKKQVQLADLSLQKLQKKWDAAVKKIDTPTQRELVMQILALKKIDPSREENLAVKMAVKYEDLDFLKKLLVDKRVERKVVLETAAESGKNKLVEGLLKNKLVYPKEMSFQSFNKVCRAGHEKVVEVLLTDPHFQVKDGVLSPLIVAAKAGRLGVAKLLVADKRVCQASDFTGVVVPTAVDEANRAGYKGVEEHLKQFQSGCTIL